jgi:uncharacterized membrane protein
MSDSGMLFCVAALMVCTPLAFAGLAWWIVVNKDSLHSVGTFYLILLSAISFSAVLFAATVIAATSEMLTSMAVFRIALPNGYACLAVVVISCFKAKHGRYQALAASAASLVVVWLIFGSLH